MRIKLYLLLWIGMGAFTFVYGQDTLTLQSFEVKVTGSSTLHDWTVTVPEVKGYMVMSEEAIQKVSFGFEVNSMDGGRGAAMNDKIKKALQGETHPWVTFESDKIQLGNNLDVNGSLNIGGVSKPQTLAVTVNNENGKKVYKGIQELTFSEYEIEPPSAMFGQIKCGDKIQVVYSLQF